MKFSTRTGMALAAPILLAACGSAENETAQSAEPAAATAQQQDSVGSVTGTIGGEQVDLYVVGGQSDHSSSHLSLYAMGEGLQARQLGALMIGAEWSGELGSNFSTAEVSIAKTGTTPARVYYADLDDGLVLTVTDSTLNGETLEVTGTVEGTLTAADRTGNRNPDPQDTLDVKLNFNANVNPL